MGLLVVRVVYAVSLSFAIWQVAEHTSVSIQQLKRSLAFSGWLAVTNIVGPMLTYFDRFYIGAMLGLAAVSYYTIPYDVLIRFLVFPAAIMAVFFPMLVSAFGNQQVQQQREVLMSANRLLGLLWLPGLVFLMLFMHELLALWLTEDLADHMTHIAQWLAVGVFINGMSMIVYNLIQSTGRSDITAKFHLLELPFYALFFWYAIGQWAVEGAALAWTLRVLVDFILLYSACYVQLPALVTVLKRLLATLVIGVVMFAVAYFVEVTALKILLAGLLMLIPIFGYHMHIINLLKRT
jgi:O-antigen/teichoic acid export membrane protein